MIRNFKNYLFLLKILFITSFIKSKSKKVFVDIREIELNRYVYNFIKFFCIEGYTVYLPCDSSLIGKISIKKGEIKYASLILNEKIKIGKPKKSCNVLWIKKEQLSNDFFNSEYYNKELCYHVPMSKYPLMYDSNNFIENQNFTSFRKKSAFMAGNFNSERYTEISRKNYFDIPNRCDLFNYISHQEYYKKIRSHIELFAFIESKEDNVILLIDTHTDFSLSLNYLLKSLEKFSFYIALPGVVMPQSHNLIEAMGSGCIPIVHKTYADIFVPSLENRKTALVYKDINDLNKLVEECFLMTQEEILILRTNVFCYYNTYLSPSAIVEKIKVLNFEKILIQAEHISVDLLKDKSCLYSKINVKN